MTIGPVRDWLGRTTPAQVGFDAIDPVPVVLPDGSTVWLRPGRPEDRLLAHQVLGGMSQESLHERFFTHRPIDDEFLDRFIERLPEYDGVTHFVWLVLDGPEGAAIGGARYVQRAEEPGTAEIAFSIVDAHQGRGIGTMLFDALALAAGVNGMERFGAELLSSNQPMARMLGRADAHLERHGETMLATLPLPLPGPSVLDPLTARRLESVVHAVAREAAALAA
jgi:protein lysine acetyltransferase